MSPRSRMAGLRRLEACYEWMPANDEAEAAFPMARGLATVHISVLLIVAEVRLREARSRGGSGRGSILVRAGERAAAPAGWVERPERDERTGGQRRTPRAGCRRSSPRRDFQPAQGAARKIAPRGPPRGPRQSAGYLGPPIDDHPSPDSRSHSPACRQRPDRCGRSGSLEEGRNHLITTLVAEHHQIVTPA